MVKRHSSYDRYSSNWKIAGFLDKDEEVMIIAKDDYETWNNY
jgi:hypothetical protein